MPFAQPATDVWMLLAHIAEETPDAPAFIHDERMLMFGALLEGSARAAQGLADLGVGPGDRVARWLPSLPAWLILYFACAPLSAIAVAVNTRYSGARQASMRPAISERPRLR
jgi:fatty-acyl-CoA synthase